MVRCCAAVAFIVLFSLTHLYALEVPRPELKLVFCYNDREHCEKGSKYQMSCAKRCKGLEYRESLCKHEFLHCEIHAPWHCYCSMKKKQRKPVLWPMNSM